MAMLEAFVHDPLINWRLLNAVDAPTTPTNATGGGLSPVPTQTGTGGFVDTIGGEVRFESSHWRKLPMVLTYAASDTG